MKLENNYFRKILHFLVVILLAIAIVDCDKNSTEPEQPKTRGDIISSESLNVYSSENIEQIMTANNIPSSFELTYSVEVIRIIYQTTDSQGNYIKVSGAIMVPVDGNNLPLLSMHHGTVTKRDRVASVGPLNSTEGLIGLILASSGYLTCVPDYPGFGVSEILHPYIHAKSLTTVVIDNIRAAKSYCHQNDITLNEKLFLAGYSEGGYVTLAAQKEIEQNFSNEFNITAVAPMAGPYDLSGTVKHIFQQSTYNSPTYIAFFLTAYDEIYGWNRLNEIFKAPYGDMMSNLFDGTKTYGEINSQLPVNISELLSHNFINNYLNGNESDFVAAIEENSLLNWKPNAPIRFYHGDADNTVPYQNALTIVDNLIANGGTDIKLVTIQGGTHETAGLPAILGMIEWFNSLRETNSLT